MKPQPATGSRPRPPPYPLCGPWPLQAGQVWSVTLSWSFCKQRTWRQPPGGHPRPDHTAVQAPGPTHAWASDTEGLWAEPGPRALASWYLEVFLRSCSPSDDSASMPPRTGSSPPHGGVHDTAPVSHPAQSCPLGWTRRVCRSPRTAAQLRTRTPSAHIPLHPTRTVPHTLPQARLLRLQGTLTSSGGYCCRGGGPAALTLTLGHRL